MPKTKFQEVVFTIMMVFVMVYAMIIYNIALNKGGMTNEVFLLAFHELVIMGPIAFILDFFLFGFLYIKNCIWICNTGKRCADYDCACNFSGNSMPDVSKHEPCSYVIV